MLIKYCGPAHDYSGYGEAVRHDIGALVDAGIEVNTQIPKYCMEISEFGRLGALATSLIDSPGEYKIKILHTTPNVYQQYMEPGKYHIGRVFWETDRLPADFAKNVELMDEIWTGSQFNADAIRKAGVTKPIYIIPEAIDIIPPAVKGYKTRADDDFKFYSIFEWTDRKNPDSLLEAFWREFEHTDHVSLTIKTYLDNFTPEKKQEIFSSAQRTKRRLGLTRYAPVYFYTNLMDRSQIYRFHVTHDCFVSAHRGEGWGIPQMEAMLMGKPIISTNCGGIHEYLENGFDSLLVSYTMIPLAGNNRNQQWYTPDQEWAQVDINHLRTQLRQMIDLPDLAKTLGENARETVVKKFSLEAVGMQMAKRLHEIETI